MKKLTLISILALISIGCSNDDSPPETSNNCNCGEVVDISYVTLANGTLRTTLKVKNNCTDEISTIGLSGHVYSLGEQYCNN